MSSHNFNKKLQKARQLMELGNHEEGLRLYARLVQQFPQDNLWNEYGQAASASGDFDLADRIWEKIRSREPNNAGLLSQLAWKYQAIGLHSKARELHAQAAKLEPGNLDTHIRRASYLARISSVSDARAAVNKCLEIDSRNELARFLSAQLDRRDNKLADAERQLRDLIDSGVRHPHVRYSCHYELAHILDRTERFDEALAQLAEGKKLSRQAANADADVKQFDAWHEHIARKTKALPKNILDTWGKSFPPRARTATAPLAFLSGSARSGTTLLERLLDAHPAVAACDESLVFAKILAPLDFTAPSIPAQRLDVLRQRYMKNLTKLLGSSGEGKLLLDKNPSRTVFLPSFLRVFPELRVLIALRDPRDVLVSLYFQSQTSDNYPTLEGLAQLYCNVMDVWLAVREWEGFAWMETRYEDIAVSYTHLRAHETGRNL